VIHRPAPAAILKAKAFLRKSKSSIFQKKYPRTYQNSIYRPVAAIQPASYRGSVYGRQRYQPQPATAYQQPYSAYKRYYAYKQQQRQKIQRLQQQQQKIQQQKVQRQKIQRLQQQQQRKKIQQQKVQRQKIQRLQQQQQQQQRQKIERLQQYQPENLRAYDRSSITRPQTQEVNPNPIAAIQQEESQADKSAIIQPKPQDTTDQFQGQVTNDVPQEEKKKQTLSSDIDTPSIKDLKQDIESAIQDALKTTSGNTSKVVTKPAVVAAVGSKTLDLSGSGSGDDHSLSGSGYNRSSGSGDNRISDSHIADMSGSGSGSKGVTSGSGSGAAVTSKKSNDKTSGES
jgi:hypothetical protein